MTTPKIFSQYGGTITFAPWRSLSNKKQIIQNLPSIMENTINNSIRPDYVNDIYLTYTIEYHKVENQDDYEAPHIHFILSTQRRLAKHIYDDLFDKLKSIGRSQLYLMTSTKYGVYKNYILKDVQTNEKKLSTPHLFERIKLNLIAPTKEEYYFDELSDDEL